jgi:hypothetical protein
MTFEVPTQLAATHEPPLRVCVELEQDKQFAGPEPEQLPQLESQL